MTHKYTSHKSSLFLLELILAILFFSIASAVCVQLFVKSHLLSKQAEILSIAVNECSDAAEIIYSADTKTEMQKRLENAYPDIQGMDDQLKIPYSTTHQTKINYELSENDSKISVSILFENISSKEVVYELNIIHYLQEDSDE